MLPTIPAKRKARKKKVVAASIEEAVSSLILELELDKDKIYTNSEIEMLLEDKRQREEFEKLEDYLCAINPKRKRLEYESVSKKKKKKK